MKTQAPAAPPNSRPGRGEAGFALIEALLAMVVLSLVAFGVLAGVEGAQKATLREAARNVAATLAEEDHERLRAQPISDLETIDSSRNVDVDGITYSVRSQVEWLSDSTGAALGCLSTSNRMDYVRLTSTVTSPVVGRRLGAVTMQSLKAPRLSEVAGKGTIAVQLRDRTGAGLPNITVALSGASSPSALTNAAGCAVFRHVGVGMYAATLNQAGYVDPDGNQLVKKEGLELTSGAVLVEELTYDRAGTLSTSFTTQAFHETAPRTVTAVKYPLVLEHTGMSLRHKLIPAGTTAPLVTGSLFPFEDPYTAYAGACATQSPAKAAGTPVPNLADYAFVVPPGSLKTAAVHLPALNVKLVWQETPSGETPLPYPGHATTARQTVTLKATLKNGFQHDNTTPCADSYTFSNAATQFHSPTDPDKAGTLREPGLPYGTWTLCAVSGGRKNTAEVVLGTKAGNLEAGNKPTKLVVNGAGSTSGTSC